MRSRAMARSTSGTSPAAIRTWWACPSPRRGCFCKAPDTTLPEWLVERGIGETRAVLIENGEIVEARIQLEGVCPAGSVIAARLTSVGTEWRNAVATDEH